MAEGNASEDLESASPDDQDADDASDPQADVEADVEQDVEPDESEEQEPTLAEIQAGLKRLEKTNQRLQGEKDRERTRADQAERDLAGLRDKEQGAERERLMAMSNEDRGAYMLEQLQRPVSAEDMRQQMQREEYVRQMSALRPFFASDEEFQAGVVGLKTPDELLGLRDKLVTGRAVKRDTAETTARKNDAAAKARKNQPEIPDSGDGPASGGKLTRKRAEAMSAGEIARLSDKQESDFDRILAGR